MDCNGSLIIGEEKRNYRGADPTFSFSQPASVAAGVLVQPLPMKKFCFPNPTSVDGLSLPGPSSDAGSSLPGPSSDAGSSFPGPSSDAGSSLPGPSSDAGSSLPGLSSDAGSSLPGPSSDAGSSLPGPSSDAGSIHPGPASDESSSSSIMASVAGSMRSKERASSDVSDLDANTRNLTNSGANEEETNVENAEINATNPVTNEERGAENTQMF